MNIKFSEVQQEINSNWVDMYINDEECGPICKLKGRSEWYASAKLIINAGIEIKDTSVGTLDEVKEQIINVLNQ